MMVFFSSCMAVKYYHELLNYIDIPVLSIHVGSMPWWYSSFFNEDSFRANKSKPNGRIRSLSSVTLKPVFFCVRMWQRVVWTYRRSTGLFNLILPMIRKYVSMARWMSLSRWTFLGIHPSCRSNGACWCSWSCPADFNTSGTWLPSVPETSASDSQWIRIRLE